MRRLRILVDDDEANALADWLRDIARQQRAARGDALSALSARREFAQGGSARHVTQKGPSGLVGSSVTACHPEVGGMCQLAMSDQVETTLENPSGLEGKDPLTAVKSPGLVWAHIRHTKTS